MIMNPLPAKTSIPTPEFNPAPEPAVNEVEVALWEALSGVMDPELGLNLVDLGLIYDLRLTDGLVRIVMTVTTPGCPMIQSLTFGVETAVLSVSGVTGVEVEVVYDPPWHADMIRPEARAAAGIR